MTTVYPVTLDTFVNPTGTDLLENASAALDHDKQHANINDAMAAVEAKLGADGSAVTTSHSYKLGEITATDKAVGKTATQTLTNKTLTSPQINFGSDGTGDIYYRNAVGVTTRLAIGTTGQILSASSAGIPEWIANPAAADASTTVKGVVELATYAETIARTTTGGTAAKLVVTPDNLTTVLTYDYVADAGSNDTYAITVTPAPTAYVAGMVFRFKANTLNTGAASLNVNSLGAITIKKYFSADLETGDIVAGQIVEVMYDASGNFQMVNLAARATSTAGVSAGPATSSTQTITHNLGKIPKIIRLKGLGITANDASAAYNAQSDGTYNASGNSCLYLQGGQGVAGNQPATSTAFAIFLSTMTVGVFGSGVVQNVTATSFDIVWTLNGATLASCAFHWEAQS